MEKESSFIVTGKVWRYPGPGGWFFVNLSKRVSSRLQNMRFAKTVGWGYIQVQATLRKTTWDTTLFPGKEGVYLIALKAQVRKKEQIEIGDTVRIRIVLQDHAASPVQQ
jgi:hypothetical protein